MKYTVQRFMAGMLILSLLATTALAADFPDVDKTASYAEAVEYLNETGIMSGDQFGNFNPNDTVTRAEMATIVCRMRGKTKNLPSDDRFSDVPVGHWANGYVSKAAELGVVTGYDTGLFGPTDKVTYEQAVTVIVRAKGWEDEAINQGGWPYGYLYAADDHGLLSGVSSFVGAPFTRSEVAQVVYNAQTASGAAKGTGTQEKKEPPKDIDLFQELKGKKFTLSDGGDWSTELTFGSNGTFTGTYRDPEPDDAEEEFSRGTVYMCDFSGQFYDAKKVNDWTYEVQLKSIKHENEPGEGWIDWGTRYVCTAPYGMGGGDNFCIFLPDTPIIDLPESFLYWIDPQNAWTGVASTLPFWGFYNIETEYGFSGKL